MPQHITIQVGQLIEHADNVRSTYDKASIDELADSILSVGLLSAPTVDGPHESTHDTGESYRVIAGHRRTRALYELVRRRKMKRTDPVGVVLQDAAVSDTDATVMMLVENVQREDISPLDEARGYARLFEDFGVTKKDIAKRTGKPQPHVTKRMALLSLPEELQALIGTEHLPIEDAYAASQLPDKAIAKLVKEAARSKSQLKYSITWETQRARRDKAKAAFGRKLAKAMIEPDSDKVPWKDWKEAEDWTAIGRFDNDSLADYTPKRGHFVVQNEESISVYRKLNKKEREKRDAEAEAHDAPPSEAELEEMDPYERWSFECSELDQKYYEAVQEYKAQVREQLGSHIKDLAPKELGKIGLGFQIAEGIQRAGEKAAHVLAIPVPETDDDGNEFTYAWQRPWAASVKEWIGEDVNRALMVYLANMTDSDDIASMDGYAGLRQALEEREIALPEEPTYPVEPGSEEDTVEPGEHDQFTSVDGELVVDEEAEAEAA